jgi:hypothetical protein
MSTDTVSIPTSTPKAPVANGKILRENFLNFSTINREGRGKFKRPFSAKKTKENPRNKQRRSPTKDELQEKHRLQAIEAMQLAEQRRLRLIQDDSNQDEDSLAEVMANVSISSVEYLPDGRIRLSRKELVARREKHRRIREAVAEQEARKKTESKFRRRLTFKPKSFAWEPRSIFKSNGRVPRSIVFNNKDCKRNSPTEIPEMKKEDGET